MWGWRCGWQWLRCGSRYRKELLRLDTEDEQQLPMANLLLVPESCPRSRYVLACRPENEAQAPSEIFSAQLRDKSVLHLVEAPTCSGLQLRAPAALGSVRVRQSMGDCQTNRLGRQLNAQEMELRPAPADGLILLEVLPHGAQQRLRAVHQPACPPDVVPAQLLRQGPQHPCKGPVRAHLQPDLLVLVVDGMPHQQPVLHSGGRPRHRRRLHRRRGLGLGI
mmetsp:Transcript_130527/g.418509  ORF Transcript_130527/g.418509 Transcript_130527/m.418509 type:complete len:221 (+) Transcript_130527:266-928(+)